MSQTTANGLGRLGQFAVLALVGGLAVTAALMRLSGSNPVTSAECQAALATAKALAPLARGEVAIFRPAKTSRSLADLAFVDGDGASITLAAFAGKTVLINFWATWCVPCRAEMPALDKLQAERGGEDFAVVAVNLDVASTSEREKAFLAEIGATHLSFYADPQLKLTATLKRRGLVFGLPTTILTDGKGCAVGVAEGAAAWDSMDAKALIAATFG